MIMNSVCMYTLLLVIINIENLQSFKSNGYVFMKSDLTSSSKVPVSISSRFHSNLLTASKILSIGTTFSILSPKISSASDRFDYIDSKNNFTVSIPDGWSVMKNKVPTPTLLKYQIEENLMVASNFLEGASLSVTRSNAPRLLKDFNIDWWFTPLNTLSNVGPPQLIAKLLILQRQFEFEKQETPSVIKDAIFLENETALIFKFTTPTPQKVLRDTVAKVYLKDNQLYVLWISSLDLIEKNKYTDIFDSFTLI